jgi:hypothetical protein
MNRIRKSLWNSIQQPAQTCPLLRGGAKVTPASAATHV